MVDMDVVCDLTDSGAQIHDCLIVHLSLSLFAFSVFLGVDLPFVFSVNNPFLSTCRI